MLRGSCSRDFPFANVAILVFVVTCSAMPAARAEDGDFDELTHVPDNTVAVFRLRSVDTTINNMIDVYCGIFDAAEEKVPAELREKFRDKLAKALVEKAPAEGAKRRWRVVSPAVDRHDRSKKPLLRFEHSPAIAEAAGFARPVDGLLGAV